MFLSLKTKCVQEKLLSVCFTLRFLDFSELWVTRKLGTSERVANADLPELDNRSLTYLGSDKKKQLTDKKNS